MPRKKLISQAAFAREVDVSKQHIGRWVVARGITKTKSGKIDHREARELWDAEHPEAKPTTTPDDQPTAVAVASDMAREKLKEKQLQVARRELELEEMRGNLIPLADLKADAEGVALSLRRGLTSMVARVSPRLEGLTHAEIQARLTTEIATVLDRLRESGYLMEDERDEL